MFIIVISRGTGNKDYFRTVQTAPTAVGSLGPLDVSVTGLSTSSGTITVNVASFASGTYVAPTSSPSNSGNSLYVTLQGAANTTNPNIAVLGDGSGGGNNSLRVAQYALLGNPADGTSNSQYRQVTGNGNNFFNEGLNYVFNGTTWDRVREASTTAIGTTGIQAAGLMRYNGTNWSPAMASSSMTNTGTCLNYTNSSSAVLSLNNSRNYALLRNFSSQIAYLGFGRTPSTINFDAFMLQYESYEINSSKLFTGAVNVIGDGSGTISVLEY